VPPFGGPPKADVYLLADTTGSMVPVLAAVQAGATAIVNDPSLAGFDVAWGVGNYRDFPVPTPNSYAFQPQLSPSSNPATNAADAVLEIGKWTAAEGSDGSEGQLFALQQIATDPAIGWRLLGAPVGVTAGFPVTGRDTLRPKSRAQLPPAPARSRPARPARRPWLLHLVQELPDDEVHELLALARRRGALRTQGRLPGWVGILNEGPDFAERAKQTQVPRRSRKVGRSQAWLAPQTTTQTMTRTD
jgi:hypothetical protein